MSDSRQVNFIEQTQRDKDHLFVFYSNGKMESTQGKLACDQDDPYILDSDIWAIGGNSLIVNREPYAKLEVLTETEITASYKDPGIEAIRWIYLEAGKYSPNNVAIR